MKALLRFFFPKWARTLADRRVDEGVVFFEAGQLERAVTCYEEAILWAPSHEWARANLGLSLVDQYNLGYEAWSRERRQAHLTLALDTLVHAVSLGAQRPAVLRAMGHLQWRLGDYSEAAQAFQNAIDLLSDDEEQDEREALGSLIETLEPMIQTAEQIKSIMTVINDNEADQNQCAQALETVKQLPEEAISETEALWLGGVLHRRLGAHVSAQEHFLKVVAIEDGHLEAHRELAQLFLHQASFELALKHSMAAYRLLPRDAGLVCNVGVCHLALNHKDKAKEFIELAYGMAPNNAIINNAERSFTGEDRGV